MTPESNAHFTARSVLASALLGEDPPELPVAHLVHLVGLFGINENRARVALSRMAAAGEVTTDGSGRYRLAGHLLDRQERQRESREGRTPPWSGTWRLAVVTATGRAPEERAARRRRLGASRMAEQREGVWLRPDNLVVRADVAGDSGLVLFTAVPDGDPDELARSLWDLTGWAERARHLLDRMEAAPTGGPEDLASGFELSASVLRHLQADPLLPDELLARSWPGRALRDGYDDWDRRYRRVLRAWGRSGRPSGGSGGHFDRASPVRAAESESR